MGSASGKSLLFLTSPKGDVWGRCWLMPASYNLNFRPAPSLRPKLSSNSGPVLYSVLVVAGKDQAEQESQAAPMAGVPIHLPHATLIFGYPNPHTPTDCLCFSPGGFSLFSWLWLHHLAAAFTLAALC